MFPHPGWRVRSIHLNTEPCLFLLLFVYLFVFVVCLCLFICLCDFGSTHFPGWRPWCIHLDADAESLGTTSKKGEKSTTNECESYYYTGNDTFSVERERMIHTLILEMIASTDFISHFKAGENKVCSHVTGRNGGLQLGMEQCSEF